jgi:DNA helicase IV
MHQEQKEAVLHAARGHVGHVCEEIARSQEATEEELREGREEYRFARSADRVTQMILIKHAEKRLDELTHLHASPYFVRCDVWLDGEEKLRTLYFAKFPFIDREIYSWAAPVATIRFEPMGDIVYTLPDKQERTGKLVRRDQYLVVDGQIVFLASEAVDAPRELIYQEHFSSRKQGFVLPEIVAQMERAQDQVIRAHHAGPFVIAGPAGSGKTTLALHRVAYLVQSPDTMHFYPTQSIIIFVQDAGTKNYFSQLLPELGIRDVKITTFAPWALALLALPEMGYVEHYGTTEATRDAYEYAKLEALRSGKLPKASRFPFSVLQKMYSGYFDSELKRSFQSQKEEGVLDRIDLTVLLEVEKARKGGVLQTAHTRFVRTRDGKRRKKTDTVLVEYALMVIDEFQNYLPEQLSLLRGTTKSSLRSTVYVGDFSQQIRFGTIRRFEDMGESVAPDRSVRLHKVYRNTKCILRYIESLGYAVEIPESMREGTPVEEHLVSSVEEEIAYVQKLREQKREASIGVLARDERSLVRLRQAFSGESNIHIFTMEESQGVEFEIVCIVGLCLADWVLPVEGASASFATEKHKILRDLLYVALTRAMAELHVLGEEKLGDILAGVRHKKARPVAFPGNLMGQ